MSPSTLGIYRAVVVRNDPKDSGRVTLKIPQILGNAVSNWAVPATPNGAVPVVGDLLFAFFDGGDTSRPVYFPG